MSITPQKILIAGASGLVGTALVRFFRERDCEVLRLVRRLAGGRDEISWDPSRNDLDPAALEGVEAIVNLAGENIGAGRWTVSRREKILRSRVETTRTLVTACEKMPRRPAVLFNASATGFYGDRREEILTEESQVGRGFLPEVCQAWESQAEKAVHLGMRVVCARFGLVLASEGGALAKMLPLFRVGLGGKLGRGDQWLSWIGLEDLIGGIDHALRDVHCAGPMNFVAPIPVRNAEFTATLGEVLRRPPILTVPAVILRAIFGRMAKETVLSSTRAAPAKLLAAGYVFRSPNLAAALARTLQHGAKL